MRITVDMIMEYGPCREYPRSRVEELWEGRDSLSAEEMRALPIPTRDLMWAWLHLLAQGGQVKTVVRLAKTFAERAKQSAVEAWAAKAEAAWAEEAARASAEEAAREARAEASEAAAARARAAELAAWTAARAARAAADWEEEYKILLDLVQVEIEAWT
jgi:hypothetical protein